MGDWLSQFHNTASPAVLYTNAAVGAAILWAKLGKKGRQVYALSDLVEIVVPIHFPRTRKLVEVVVFLALGTYITVEVFGPSTGGQAFAAGLGWTGLASK